MKRRGFLGALLAAPVMAKAAPLPTPVADGLIPKAVTVSKLFSGDMIILGTITSNYLTVDSAVVKVPLEDTV